MSLLSDLNDKIKRLSTRVAAEFKAQQAAIDSKVSTVNGIAPDENGNVEIAAGNAALPLGWEYTRLVSDSAPKGGVDYLGQEATREFYADLWEWVNIEHPGRIISEEDWQAMYAAQNGNVPYYSTGDGSTTFRFPRTVSYLRVGDTAGQYTAEGLPNITGDFRAYRLYTEYLSSNGALYEKRDYGSVVNTPEYNADTSYATLGFDASFSNPIYGASDHVTPESITVVMGVIAFGEVRTLGTVAEENILAEMKTFVKKSGDTMTGVLSLDTEDPEKLYLTHTGMDAAVVPSGELRSQLWFRDKNFEKLGCLEYIQLPTGETTMVIEHRSNLSGEWHSFGQRLGADGRPMGFSISSSVIAFGNNTAFWIA